MDTGQLMSCLYVKHELIKILAIEYIESVLVFYKIKTKHEMYNSS